MSNSSFKKPAYHSLTKFTESVINNYDALRGKIIPASVVAVSGAIVTVEFLVDPTLNYPIVKMPLVGSNYFRDPIQVGDTGVAIASDFSIGGISGLGIGIASSVPPANLSAMFFVPIGKMTYPTVNPEVATVQAPQGVTLQDLGKLSVFNLTPSGITFSVGSTTITINATEISLTAGGMTLLINSLGITLNGILFLLHTHPVTTAPGTTGTVTP